MDAYLNSSKNSIDEFLLQIDLGVDLMKIWQNNLEDTKKFQLEDFDKVLTNILELVRELSLKNYFSSEKYETESEIYFANSFGPSLIKNILLEKMKNSEIRLISRDILEIFLREFARNFTNSKLNAIWIELLEAFYMKSKFYENQESKDICERYWVKFKLKLTL